jgi:osmotically-inducible protein OsmY
MSDQSLRQDVIDELQFEASLDAANIGVAAKDGVVTLTGHVRSYIEKVKAEEVVSRVKGVQGIAQDLQVHYPSDPKTSDDEIAHRAVDIIRWDTTLPGGAIRVRVENGSVTLTGKVEWYYQKQAAENAVKKLHGVKTIYNLVSIEPTVQPSDIQERIEGALKRNAELEAGRIHVSVRGHKVTLEGSVDTWSERIAAESAAWAAPGVDSVEDKLHVV